MDASRPYDPTTTAQPSRNGNSAGLSQEAHAAEDGPGIWNYARHDFDRETTRYLSAATQLDVRYAHEVVRNVIGEPLRALAPAYGADISTVACWAVDSIMRRARRDRYLAITLLAAIALMPLTLIWLPMILIILVGVMLAAWSIVSMEHWTRIHLNVGKMLRGVFDTRTAPEPRPAWVRERISAVSIRRRGNLVVFHGQSAFVGSGHRLSRQHIVIDVSRGKKVKNGKQQKPRKFTNADVHTALIAAMKRLGFTELTVEERLFVNGRHIKGNPAFLPQGPSAPPACSVSPALLQQATLHPTPDARVYVCVEMPAWQGQLMVTLFVRAVHTGGYLYIEWEYYVLRPIRRQFRSIDRRYNRSRCQQLWKSYRWGAKRFLPALANAPFLLISDIRGWTAEKKRISRQLAAIRNGQDFDYGASRSVREMACGVTPDHHFLERDEIMYVLMSQVTLMRAIRVFLRKHDVSLGEFDEQVQAITQVTFKRYNINISDVSDSAIAIGKNTSAKSKS